MRISGSWWFNEITPEKQVLYLFLEQHQTSIWYQIAAHHRDYRDAAEIAVPIRFKDVIDDARLFGLPIMAREGIVDPVVLA